MHHLLWEWLSESFGYDVAGEVSIGDKRIDLVAESPDGFYVGYEVKDQNQFNEPNDVVELINQLNSYAHSGYLDYLYYCSQNPLVMTHALDSDNQMWDIQSINEAANSTNPLQGLSRENIVSPPEGIGFIRVPWINTDEEAIKIERHAEELRTPRSQTPELPRQNEAWVEHHAWQEIRNDEAGKYGAVSEGVLPDPDGRNTRRIDIIGFYGSLVPGEILRNQEKERFDMIGVEAKGSKPNGELSDQLSRYVRSQALTQVYLAIPASDERIAWDVLGTPKQRSLDDFFHSSEESEDGWNQDLDKVGIMTVDERGHVEYVKDADELKMTYDGFINADSGRNTILTVGWGRFLERLEADDVESVYNQLDDVYRKAQAIDTDCVEKLFSQHEYRKIFQFRQKVLGGGGLGEAERYLFDKAYEMCGDKTLKYD